MNKKYNNTYENFYIQTIIWKIKCEKINKTCVIYLNDNNGYTEFRDGKKILSVKNTAVVFDSNLEHRGVPSTDTRRLVLNINYFEK